MVFLYSELPLKQISCTGDRDFPAKDQRESIDVKMHKMQWKIYPETADH